MSTRVFDYVPKLDERNRAHRITAAPDLTKIAIYWSPGAVLDQGQQGSCVGHGVTGEYLASPVRGKGNATTGHELAVAVYNEAKVIDHEKATDEGTSVRAGMLAARARGWYDGFSWAFNMAELRTALQIGPVVIGSAWSSDAMEDTLDNGDLPVSGDLSEGHCTLVTGYTPLFGRSGPRYRLRNSWGRDWGLHGDFYLTPADLDKIVFKSGGEAAVPTARHL